MIKTVTLVACLCLARTSLAELYHPRNGHLQNIKELNTILASIEERLRVLDTVSAVQTSQARRLEVIQDKLDRIETTLTLKLERVQLATDRLEHRLHMLHTSFQGDIKENSDQMAQRHIRIVESALNLTNNINSQKNILKKVTEIYTETTRRGLILESLMRDSLSLVNVTRREISDGLKTVARRQAGVRLTWQSDLDSIIFKRFNDSTQKIDTKIDEILDTHKSCTDSCQRVQLDDPTHVTEVLDKLIDSMINKTTSTFQELQNIQVMMRNHDTKVSKYINAGQSAQPDVTCRRVENVLRNITSTPLKNEELNHLTEKFIDLTERADAALQKLEIRVNLDDDDEPFVSDVTAEADQLIFKLDSIKNEEEKINNDQLNWDDNGLDDGYFDNTDNSEDVLTENIKKNSDTDGLNNKSPQVLPVHRRHMSKHPYDRGPN